MREVVVPGEKIAEGKNTRAGYGTFKSGEEVFAAVHGLLSKEKEFVKVVPLAGGYMPRQGDQVIGIVEQLMGRGCFIDLNSAYSGYLPFFRDRTYNVGDLLIMEVMSVDEVNKVDLDFAKSLYDGKLITVSPVKIPRIVGKKGSMLDVLSTGTKCKIFVGKNGRIFLKGDDSGVRLAEEAIRLIAEQAHTDGLTDRIKKFLEER